MQFPDVRLPGYDRRPQWRKLDAVGQHDFYAGSVQALPKLLQPLDGRSVNEPDPASRPRAIRQSPSSSHRELWSLPSTQLHRGARSARGTAASSPTLHLDYPDLVRGIGDLWPGNTTIDDLADRLRHRQGQRPHAGANRPLHRDLATTGFGSFGNPGPPPEWIPGFNPSTLAPQFHALWTALGLNPPPLNTTTVDPAADEQRERALDRRSRDPSPRREVDRAGPRGHEPTGSGTRRRARVRARRARVRTRRARVRTRRARVRTRRARVPNTTGSGTNTTGSGTEHDGLGYQDDGPGTERRRARVPTSTGRVPTRRRPGTNRRRARVPTRRRARVPTDDGLGYRPTTGSGTDDDGLGYQRRRARVPTTTGSGTNRRRARVPTKTDSGTTTTGSGSHGTSTRRAQRWRQRRIASVPNLLATLRD